MVTGTIHVFMKNSNPGIMVWGAIGHGFRSSLIQCTNTVDANEYIEILKKSQLIQTCDMKYGRFKWFFMQDGAILSGNGTPLFASQLNWLK